METILSIFENDLQIMNMNWKLVSVVLHAAIFIFKSASGKVHLQIYSVHPICHI